MNLDDIELGMKVHIVDIGVDGIVLGTEDGGGCQSCPKNPPDYGMVVVVEYGGRTARVKASNLERR